MKLSIITVNYNNAEGLRNTIESVLCQDFTDFEYIIIDGASDDGSPAIIQGYVDHSEYNNSITYWVSETDIGIYNAMNKGIEKASGEYLIFLNSGDCLVNHNVLTKAFVMGFTEDIVVGGCDVSNDGKVIFTAFPPQDISLAAFWGRTIPHQAAFIKRELFNKYGMYAENFRIHADLDFFLKTIILGNCTYLKIPIIISDYNLDGISSDINFGFISDTEKETIINALIPTRILSDYNKWDGERKAIEPLVWASKKPFLNFFVVFMYNTATSVVTLRKKIRGFIYPKISLRIKQ